MKPRRLVKRTHVAQPIDTVFGFFSEAENLEAITPPWLGFEILTPLPILMYEGQVIDYRIRLHGIPLSWRSEITAWDPPFSFVDEQRRGPYRSWRHEHHFVERDGGTDVVDEVEYSVWGGALVDRLFVRRDVEKIFDYRARCLRLILEGCEAGSPSKALRTSATGALRAEPVGAGE